MTSPQIGFIEQRAISDLNNFGATIDFLQKEYERTGDEEFQKARNRLLAIYLHKPFAGAPASENNSETPSKFTGAPEATDCKFTDRVKAIISKAAEKNGQRMVTGARGHEGSYIFSIDAQAFCEGIDKLVLNHKSELKEYLGGSMRNVQVTRVCHFIGHVVRMHVVNDSKLQLTDMAFAFEDYYKNLDTVRKKLSVKSLSYQEKDFFNFVNSSLESAKRSIYAKREHR
ncbi:MAG: hypothetical protein IKO17_07470 [Prevotella sp.]|jgi:hypothetical protein|nr:hypothetical protein [Prevotella sp.]